jgi:large subunit ribosomal protein L24
MKNLEQNSKSHKKPRIRKGDHVVVIAGAKKGTTGRVLAVYPKTDRILVEGIAIAKRAYRRGANPNMPDGGIHEKEMPIHISNVMLVDPKSNAPTRVGVRVETDKDGNTRRVRVAKRSGADIQ